MTRKKISGFLVLFIGWVLAAGFLAAQDKAANPILTLDRIFAGREFAASASARRAG